MTDDQDGLGPDGQESLRRRSLRAVATGEPLPFGLVTVEAGPVRAAGWSTGAGDRGGVAWHGAGWGPLLTATLRQVFRAVHRRPPITVLAGETDVARLRRLVAEAARGSQGWRRGAQAIVRRVEDRLLEFDATGDGVLLRDARAAATGLVSQLQGRPGSRRRQQVEVVTDGPELAERARRMARERQAVLCHADGSVADPDNGTTGGWAWWVDRQRWDAGVESGLAGDGLDGGAVAVELRAVIRALEDCPGDRLVVTTDCDVVDAVVSGHGDCPRARKLRELARWRNVTFARVKGHTDPDGHNLADQAARAAQRGRLEAFRRRVAALPSISAAGSEHGQDVRA